MNTQEDDLKKEISKIIKDNKNSFILWDYLNAYIDIKVKKGQEDEQKRILNILDKWLFVHQAIILKGSWKELEKQIKEKK